MNCWKCGKRISELHVKIGFRAACTHCEADLHVCKNCRYYMPGKPNDCMVPGTEPIRDREAANFCEEFREKIPSSQTDKPSPKKNFDSLFKDENPG